MKKMILGNTGLEVTELCFGALPMGPLQKNLTVETSAEIVAMALENGVTFVDTAQMYRTYPPIREALRKTGLRPIIATKSTAATYEEMEKAINEALEGMGIDYIDIFHLHAAKAALDVFEVRKGALQCLLDYKKKGIIKAIGISTHSIKLVEAASERPEIDVVFPLINKTGRGIIDGTSAEMQKAMELCRQKGKGLYLMKVLGGGTLIDDYTSCMEYARSLPGGYPIALGMVSMDELVYNLKYFNGEKDLAAIAVKNKKEFKVMQGVCQSCGKCIEGCHSDAMSLNAAGKAEIDQSKCIQCGYCVASCPHFAIRAV